MMTYLKPYPTLIVGIVLGYFVAGRAISKVQSLVKK